MTITATDSDGAVTTTTFNLVVNNVAPSVARNNASVTVNEGATAANTGTWSDPGLDVVTLTASTGSVTKNNDGTWSWSFNTNDGPDQTQTVTITATDSDGAVSTTTFNLVVNNVAPNVARNNATVTVNEGTTASNSGTFSDPGLDTVTVTASIGTITQASGTWSWSFGTNDGPAQGQTVTITATDSDGAASTTTFALVVNNLAPTATLSNGGAVNEGTAGSVSFSAQADASSVDTSAGFRYAFDFDNNGTFEVGSGTYAGSVTTASATVPASFLVDGPAARVVRGRILDKDGSFTDYTTSITINNVAPTATLTNGGSVNAGSNGSVSFSGQSDPSSVDTTAGFRYAYDFDNNGTFDSGNGTYAGSGTSASATVPSSYLVGAGAHVVRGRIIDKDGGSTDYTTTIIVNNSGVNVPPVIVSITNSSPECGFVTHGDQVTVSATFTDANATDTHTATINWGDGTTTVGTVTESNGSGVVAGSHAYATGGFFTITVTVSDNNGGVTSRTTDTVISGVRLLPNGQILIIGTDGRDQVVVHRGGQGQVRVETHLNQGGGNGGSDGGGDNSHGNGNGNGNGGSDGGSDGGHDCGDESYTFNAASVTGILMYLCDGDDHAVIGGGEGGSDGGFDIPATIYGEAGNDHLEGGNGRDLLDGGDGNDVLHGGKGDDVLLGQAGDDNLTGAAGNDILVGGDGSDRLQGDAGRDILIGGNGADSILGGDDDDVLIAGATSYDNNVASLSLLRTEWTSAANYATRSANLINGTGAVLTGTGVKLKASGTGRTVFGDAEKDTLSGQNGSDLFFASLNDNVKDKAASETLLSL